MKRQWKLRQAGLILALLAGFGGACLLTWAQPGDTPIIISDGSLTITSTGVRWDQFTGTGDEKSHPHNNKSITSVVATIDGKDNPVTYSGEAAMVDITYGGGHITFGTASSGRGMTMRPFGQFHAGARPTVIVHNNPNAHITHVRIMKGGAVGFEGDATKGTTVTIHFQ
jgi:hypothetical protein